MHFDPKPVILAGTHVRLEPLSAEHLNDLFEAGKDPAIWIYMTSPAFGIRKEAQAWLSGALSEMERGLQIAFAITLQPSGRAIGSTRFLNIRRKDRVLEIGWTWIGSKFQRSAVNTECKFLLLQHAFEELGAVRVEFKTDSRNIRSQKALERIGAVREGILRKHMILKNGYIRDTVYYSIIDDEWPGIKSHLQALMNKYPAISPVRQKG